MEGSKLYPRSRDEVQVREEKGLVDRTEVDDSSQEDWWSQAGGKGFPVRSGEACDDDTVR